MSGKWEPQKSLLGLIISVGSRMRKDAQTVLEKNNLKGFSLGRIGVLAVLDLKPQTAASLCEYFQQKPSSMKEMLERLQKDRLAKSRPHPTDGRKTEWELTANGRRALEKSSVLLRAYGRSVDVFFRERGIPEDDLQRFRELLIIFTEGFLRRKNEGS